MGKKMKNARIIRRTAPVGGVITAGEDHGGHYLQIVSTSQQNKNIWNERLPVLTSLVLVLHDDQPCRHNCRTFTVKFFIV